MVSGLRRHVFIRTGGEPAIKSVALEIPVEIAVQYGVEGLAIGIDRAGSHGTVRSVTSAEQRICIATGVWIVNQQILFSVACDIEGYGGTSMELHR